MSADELRELRRRQLEQECEGIGRLLGNAVQSVAPVGQRWGFCLLMFDQGDTGSLAYCANAEREDMIRTLEEFRQKLIEGRQ
ncbi:MAG TPA: hypothetical protein VFQ87_03280 [Bradyrhizobium sp.]|nr:hypothetical protein [Bradyrhizobium sp.]